MQNKGLQQIRRNKIAGGGGGVGAGGLTISLFISEQNAVVRKHIWPESCCCSMEILFCVATLAIVFRQPIHKHPANHVESTFKRLTSIVNGDFVILRCLEVGHVNVIVTVRQNNQQSRHTLLDLEARRRTIPADSSNGEIMETSHLGRRYWILFGGSGLVFIIVSADYGLFDNEISVPFVVNHESDEREQGAYICCWAKQGSVEISM